MRTKVSIVIITAYICSLLALVSCNGKQSGTNVKVESFTKTVTLTGTPVNMSDSVVRVIGSVYPTDNGYVFYQYGNPYLLLATDKEFNLIKAFARKGEGPGEVSSVSDLFGQKLDNGFLTVFDSYTKKMYGADPKNNYQLMEVDNFADTSFDVWAIARMKNGTFVGARSDFRYGLIAIDADRKVSEWPVGYEFNNPDNPDNEYLSLRVLDYNPERGILGEIYGKLPVVILHDENGNIVKTIIYTEYKAVKKENGRLSDCFCGLSLTSKYIYVLKGDRDTDDNSEILVFDYDGTPVASLEIPYAQIMTVDEAANRILAIDANQEENNVMIYEIPDFLRK